MPSSLNRRELLRGAACAGIGLWAAGASPLKASANEKLNVGLIGVGGRGGAHVDALGKTENIVAICDVDDGPLQKVASRFPNAKVYKDWRKLLEQNDVEAVTVATPDHVHAFAGIAAMQAGKHVYCEKPLTHSIYEARQMAKQAERHKVVTQMGNQGHSNDGTRRVVELVRAGVVGPIREVHCWTDRPIWPQGMDRPADTPPVPAGLDWDLWLGPAPERPYNPAYHPFKWRGWWDFGTGALGDMACHVMDTAYWALDLRAPTSVQAEFDPKKPETAPKWSVIRYEFPERGSLPSLRLTWYDGGKLPSADLIYGDKMPDNGTILVGEKGAVLLPDPYGSSFVLLPKEKFQGVQLPAPTIPNSIGHHAEWVAACKKGSDARHDPGSNFSYSSGLTEMVLLGNLALRTGQPIEWDAKRMRATNCPEADQYIHNEYRNGWSL